MKNEIMLSGCRPAPLSSYLKALGVFRLLSEQSDIGSTATTCRWENDILLLRTEKDPAQVISFFCDSYTPTPIVAPWNGGSGFYYQEEKLKERDSITGKKIKTGMRNQPTSATKALDNILNSQCSRFFQYRKVLNVAKQAVLNHGFEEAPKGEKKHLFLNELRNCIPDDVILCLDSGLTISNDRPGYAPLLGTGWNDGNLDFSNNFMQRLLELFDAKSGEPSLACMELLSSSLFGNKTIGLFKASVGQFNPGGAGGPNATTGFEGASHINPWDFVLMLEGALLFAGVATRRLESGPYQSLSYPFTVRSAAAGSGTISIADETAARAEMWLPIWHNWTSLNELQSLFGEGRATLKGKAVRDGFDFARAVSTLGIDRGIESFQRYHFLKRSGDAFLSTPAGRLPVTQKDNHTAKLISALDRNGWLDSLRSSIRLKNASGKLQQVVRRLENAVFSMTFRNNRLNIQNTIALLGAIEQICSQSKKATESIRPMPPLPEEWVLAADDGSPEFRIACALAGIHAPGLAMRAHLCQVRQLPGKTTWNWAPGSSLAVWGGGGLVRNLIRVLQRRLIEAQHQGLSDKPLDSYARADLSEILSFLNYQTDDRKIETLLRGLVFARMPKKLLSIATENETDFPPLAFSLLKPFFTTDNQLRWLNAISPETSLPLPANLVQWLASDRPETIEKAIVIAWQKVKMSGIEVPTPCNRLKIHISTNGSRLLASLLIPMKAGAMANMLKALSPRSK